MVQRQRHRASPFTIRQSTYPSPRQGFPEYLQAIDPDVRVYFGFELEIDTECQPRFREFDLFEPVRSLLLLPIVSFQISNSDFKLRNFPSSHHILRSKSLPAANAAVSGCQCSTPIARLTWAANKPPGQDGRSASGKLFASFFGHGL